MAENPFIPIAEPLFQGNETKYLTDCISTGWISSIGKYVGEFEQGFADYIGCTHGAAVHTGTAALHLALLAIGIGPGDEVIIPTLTFAATANAVLYTGATPVFVDSERETWNIDPDLIENKITKKTRAIIPVHLYGHPCDMDKITEISQKYNLTIIEDAAEAHGAEYKGQRVGSMGTISCFSFFGNKIITTGEGGMCLCHDQDLIEKIAKLRDHGMVKNKRYWHDEIGFNYRMTNLQAAVGVAQLEKLDWFVNRKKENATLYNSCLSGQEKLTLPPNKSWAKNVFWLYTVLLKKGTKNRDQLIRSLKDKGIESRPVFYPLHEMEPYKEFSNNDEFPVATQIAYSGLSLPSAPTLKEDQIRYICTILEKNM